MNQPNQPTHEFHFLSGFVGGVVGYGIAELFSRAPAITERWPFVFAPFWKYFLLIGVFSAVLGAIVAAMIAPHQQIRGSADLAAVIVGMAVSLFMLPQRPSIIMLILLTIPYGFVGHTVGTFVWNFRSEFHNPDADSQ